VTAPQIDFSVLDRMGPPSTTSQCCFCGAFLRPIGDGKWFRCPVNACFQRALRYLIRNDTAILFIPNPIQVKLFEAVVPLDVHGHVIPCAYKNILFGGSRGSSKSFALRWLCYWLCLHFPNFKVLFLRRTFVELEDSHLVKVRQEQGSLDIEINSKYQLPFHTGSMITFGHCAEAVNITKYLSADFDLIVFDESGTFGVSMLTQISTSARVSAATTPHNWRCIVVKASNPGGIAGAYNKAMYVNHDPDPDEYPNYVATDYLYINSRLEDNPHLPLEEYDKTLRQTPEKYAQWRWGDWDSAIDQFFSEYRKQDIVEHGILYRAHELSTDQEPITAHLDWVVTLDFNFKKPGVAYWIACHPNGTFTVMYEFKFVRTLAKTVARTILSRNRALGLTIRHVVMSDELANRPTETGESILETFRNVGLPVIRSKHHRLIGWARLHALLADNDKHTPYLRVFKPNCPYLCQTLPAIIEHPTEPDEIVKKNDAAANALRYFGMARPAPGTQSVVSAPTREQLRGRAGGVILDDDPRQTVSAGGSYRRSA
jgi:hypothetical protein